METGIDHQTCSFSCMKMHSFNAAHMNMSSRLSASSATMDQAISRLLRTFQIIRAYKLADAIRQHIKRPLSQHVEPLDNEAIPAFAESVS